MPAWHHSCDPQGCSSRQMHVFAATTPAQSGCPVYGPDAGRLAVQSAAYCLGLEENQDEGSDDGLKRRNRSHWFGSVDVYKVRHGL